MAAGVGSAWLIASYIGPSQRPEDSSRSAPPFLVQIEINTPEVRRTLERLASGLDGARETIDAKGAIRRLDSRASRHVTQSPFP